VVFLRRVLIVAAVVLLLLLLWALQAALLVVFAGIVIAVLLQALARPLQRRLGLPHGWALALVALALIALLGAAGYAMGGQVRAQVSDLSGRLPAAISKVATPLGLHLPWIDKVVAPTAGVPAATGRAPADSPPVGTAAGRPAAAAEQGSGVGLSTVGTVAQEALGLGAGVLNALSALVVAVVGGFFLAADPLMYRRGVAMLLPWRLRGRALRAMVACGRALRLWMGAQLVSMVFVGVLSGLGTWQLGLPAPLALGLFAGLCNVVPFLGAFVGAVPAIMLGLAAGTSTALWTSLLYLVVQQLEGNVVTPMAQRSLVSLPPAMLVFAVIAIGLLFGLPGVVLATPITVCVFVLVKMLYVRQTLGTPTEVPGEPE